MTQEWKIIPPPEKIQEKPTWTSGCEFCPDKFAPALSIQTETGSRISGPRTACLKCLAKMLVRYRTAYRTTYMLGMIREFKDRATEEELASCRESEMRERFLDDADLFLEDVVRLEREEVEGKSEEKEEKEKK